MNDRTALKPEHYRFLIEKALEEDLGDRGDITSDAIFSSQVGEARIVAKQEGVLAGAPVAAEVFRHVDGQTRVEFLLEDGSTFAKGDEIARIAGKVRSLLRAERTVLNFLGRLSGVATLTRRFVEAVEGTGCKILDTRKTTPAYRVLEKYAVRMGGGVNHRFGLYDMVLIKDNHIAAAGGVSQAVERVRSYLHSRGIASKIEVEVTSLAQLQEALALKVDRIMLDNMSLEEMRRAVEIAAGRVLLEASGNVTLERVRAIAETGVDFISVGALTHSAPVCDFSMRMEDNQ
ncbi:MAG TPA: carboxylating nicotinate-nucleotide diphosphorylase [Bacteroidetes bacterium]|nr:carboxylating nicotinate-nucleotide diphosphorylase [Bacteroidota bacterium]